MKRTMLMLLNMSITIFFLIGCGKNEKIQNPSDSKITAIPTTSINENHKTVDENLGLTISSTVSPIISSTINPTITPNASLSEEALAIEAYISVLQNKSCFYNSDDKMNIHLKDFLSYGNAGFDVELSCSHFTILDMDEDKISEVILDLSFYSREESDFSLVLNYMKGSITGYLLSQKNFEQLKSDGSFTYSWGAGDWGFAKLKFTADDYESIRFGYVESSGSSDSYFINNKPGTESSFETLINEQEDKKDVIWYEFSKENIEAKLSNN